mgnify:CR=1 FL=1
MSELDIRLLLTALVSVLLLVALIVSRIRMHPLLALLVVAVGVGLFAGMDIDRVARAVTNGAGKTLGAVGIIIALMTAYAIMFERLGYPITTFVVFIAGALVLDRKHMVRDVFISIVSSFGMFYVFTKLLRVTLPAGPLNIFGW